LPKVHTIGKTEIRVYANDHLPPHFHIVNPDFEALIVIEDFSIYAGYLKGTAGKEAMKWAQANVSTIKAEWNRVNPRYPAK
jgi:hypothetical protein